MKKMMVGIISKLKTSRNSVKVSYANNHSLNFPTPLKSSYTRLTSRLDLLDDFLLNLRTNNYSPQTVKSYKWDLAIFDNFLISKDIHLGDLNKRLVFEFKADITSDNGRLTPLKHTTSSIKLSSASVNRCLSAIKSYLRFLIDQDFPIPIAPDHFKPVKREKSHLNLIELKDLVRLIEAPSAIESSSLVAARNRAILEVLFATGMRISELISLNRIDLNSEGKIFITGKGRKQRFVYLTQRARRHVDLFLSSRNDNNPALFVSTGIRGEVKRLTARYVQERIQSYRQALGINLPVTPHTFRHGFATYLAEKGASPAAIQILLGHESLNTTTRYVNASDRFAQETHQKYHPLLEEN